MKKLGLILLATLSLNMVADAQKLKDKLNKLAGGEKTEDASSTTPTSSGVAGNQFEKANEFLAGDKRIYMTKNASGDWIAAPDKKAFAEQFYNKLEKDNAGNVISADGMKPNDDKNPLFYSIANKEDYVLIFLDGAAFNCKMVLADSKITEINQIYATKKLGMIVKNAELLSKLNNYLETNRHFYDDKKKAIEAERLKRAEEEKQAQSVEGLEVKSIKIIFGDGKNEITEIQYNQTLDFSIEATLKDGSKKLTPGSSQYANAYEMSTEGTEGKVLVNGMITQNFVYVPNDIITLNVKLKSNPKVSTIATLKMNHTIASILDSKEFSFGSRHGNSNWDKAPDARVEIKKVKNTLTNEDMIGYKIYFGSDSEASYAFKTTAKQYVKVHADATNSTTGKAVSPTEKGYAAGNIKVIMDPSVPDGVNFVTSAKGGQRKGDGGTSSMMGSDGKIETVKTKVSW